MNYGISHLPPPSSRLILKGNDKTNELHKKLDSLKEETKKNFDFEKQLTEVNKRIDNVIELLQTYQRETDEKQDTRLEMCENRMQEMDNLLFGNDETNTTGLMSEYKTNMEKMREEYIELITKYIENSMHKTETERLDNIERRLTQIEQKKDLSGIIDNNKIVFSNMNKSGVFK